MTTTIAPTAVDRPASAPTVPSIGFGRLLGVEWRKMLSARAARWVAGLVVLSVVAVVAIAVIFAAPDQIPQVWTEYLGLASLGLSLLLPVMAILAITSEWTQRTALVTYAQEPRRGRVLAAKAVNGALLALVGAAVALATTSAGLALSGALGRDVEWDLSWRSVLALVVFNVLNVVTGSAFAALLHNTAATIVLFYLQSVVWGILGSLPPIQRTADWLDPNHALGWIAAGDWADHWGHIAVALTVWVVVPMTAGALRTLRREVS